MGSTISQADRERIEQGIRNKYKEVARSPQGQFAYPTGKEGLRRLQYDPSILASIPDDVASFYCGVGNPFSIGIIRKGGRILDVGCGAGVDTIIAALLTGGDGNAVGVDIVREMLRAAEKNAKKSGVSNVGFQNASGEKLPFSNEAFDTVISNGAINLIPDKEKAVAEVFRVLKPGGWLMMADQAASGPVQPDLKNRLAHWFR